MNFKESMQFNILDFSFTYFYNFKKLIRRKYQGKTTKLNNVFADN
jgi:hypothetical protein